MGRCYRMANKKKSRSKLQTRGIHFFFHCNKNENPNETREIFHVNVVIFSVLLPGYTSKTKRKKNRPTNNKKERNNEIWFDKKEREKHVWYTYT